MRIADIARLTICLFAASATVALAEDRAHPLVAAVKSGNHVRLVTVLRGRPAVDALDNDGMTALQWAARQNDDESVLLLLGAKANPAIATRYGSTALSFACENRNAGMVKTLLRAGAPAGRESGGSPLNIAPIHIAARAGDDEIVKLLLAAGAAVDTERHGRDRPR